MGPAPTLQFVCFPIVSIIIRLVAAVSSPKLDTPLTLDASVVIKLNASGHARTVLSAFRNPMVVIDEVETEIGRGNRQKWDDARWSTVPPKQHHFNTTEKITLRALQGFCGWCSSHKHMKIKDMAHLQNQYSWVQLPSGAPQIYERVPANAGSFSLRRSGTPKAQVRGRAVGCVRASGCDPVSIAVGFVAQK